MKMRTVAITVGEGPLESRRQMIIVTGYRGHHEPTSLKSYYLLNYKFILLTFKIYIFSQHKIKYQVDISFNRHF